MKQAGEFSGDRNVITLAPRGGELAGKTIKVTFPAAERTKTNPNPAGGRGIQSLEVVGEGRTEAVQLDPPLLTALMTSGAREKRRHVPLATIPERMQQAVLAIEDQSFYSHPGVNPFRHDRRGDRAISCSRGRPSGASTITQQLSRMFFLADEFNAELQSGSAVVRLVLRKAREIVMSLVLERTRVEGRDPRALSQRRLPRPARLVRAFTAWPKRRASSSARTSPTSRIS